MMRVARLLSVVCAGLMCSSVARARAQGIGVGAMLGEPMASTLMVRWDDRQAVQLLAGWSLGQQRLHMGADYLFSPTEIESDDAMGLHYPVYVGLGLRLRLLGEDTTAGQERGNFGVRFPFGVSVEPDHVPLEIYFEMAPVWVVSPISHGGFDGGIGVRIFM
jgi:hypothetical protein